MQAIFACWRSIKVQVNNYMKYFLRKQYADYTFENQKRFSLRSK